MRFCGFIVLYVFVGNVVAVFAGYLVFLAGDLKFAECFSFLKQLRSFLLSNVFDIFYMY